jgi:Tol biopolymer transport system component
VKWPPGRNVVLTATAFVLLFAGVGALLLTRGASRDARLDEQCDQPQATMTPSEEVECFATGRLTIPAAAPEVQERDLRRIPLADARFIRLSFVRGSGIFVASRSGTTILPVVKSAGDSSYSEPDWSQNGRLAATDDIYRSEGTGESNVEILRPKPTRTVPCCISGFAGMPSWAPDGRRLVLVGIQYFEPYVEGGLEVWREESNDTVTLTDQLSGDGSPAWSPDGSWIAFSRSEGGDQPPTLYLIHPDGSGLRGITNAHAENPSWSPDGRLIAFDDGARIALVRRDGTGLTYPPGLRGVNPAWSPAGRTIAFERSGDLWLADASGRNQRLFLHNASEPAWKREIK